MKWSGNLLEMTRRSWVCNNACFLTADPRTTGRGLPKSCFLTLKVITNGKITHRRGPMHRHYNKKPGYYFSQHLHRVAVFLGVTSWKDCSEK